MPKPYAERKEYFKQWYKKNKDRISKDRYNRYRNDDEYREGRIDYSRKHYWMMGRRAKYLEPKAIDIDSLKPNEIADIIVSNENDVRCDLTVSVPMYYPAQLSECIGKNVQTIRLWSLKGILPESTYRNLLNYRIYTKDQMKVYTKHAHLLKLTVKDFSRHPYFFEVRRDLLKLEPDGIELMHKDNWRLVEEEQCIWCKSEPSLYYYNGKEWKPVQCFDCRDPYDIRGRIETEKQDVSGYCNFCDETVYDTMYVIGKIPILICPKCGTRAQDVKVGG